MYHLHMYVPSKIHTSIHTYIAAICSQPRSCLLVGASGCVNGHGLFRYEPRGLSARGRGGRSGCRGRQVPPVVLWQRNTGKPRGRASVCHFSHSDVSQGSILLCKKTVITAKIPTKFTAVKIDRPQKRPSMQVSTRFFPDFLFAGFDVFGLCSSAALTWLMPLFRRTECLCVPVGPSEAS
jgi:hypothetical protein